jgi:aspartyl-tRNA(Asn)/glutamyl-tRNA(Gln) amidotransferase subunit A
MLISGTTISAVDYIRAKRVINEELKKGFLTMLNRDIDVLVMPTTIISAPRFDELMTIDIGDTGMQTREALLRNTTVFNSIGFPAVSLPIGLTKDNMPVAAKIIGPPFTEVAYNYESVDHK